MANVLTTVLDKAREPIKMPDEMRTILKEMYLIRSYSGFEEPMRRYIMAFLDKLNIPYVNFNGNILGFNYPGMPLFGAHMDMVNTEGYKLKGTEMALDENHVFTVDKDTNIRLYRDKEKKNQTSLGADDKNGIWVILMLIAEGHPINFAFFHSEEVGHIGSSQVAADEELGKFIEGCQYGIIIDRRNHWDIIGYDNKYCMGLDDRLSSFASDFDLKFTPARGSISDADSLSPLIECVNLSCGYYEPHSSREYTNLNELWDTYLLCKQMLDYESNGHFDYVSVSAKRMQDFKSARCPYNKVVETTTYSYGSSWRKEEDDDKKSTKKKTKKINTTTTKSKDGIGDDVLIDDDSFVDIFEECKDRGISYDIESGFWVIPLWEKPEEVGATVSDMIRTTYCPECGTMVTLLQQSIDALYLEYYDKKKDKCIGLCEHCHKPISISSDINYLM